MRKLFLLSLALLASFNLWADATHSDPATVTYGGKTFLDAANTPGNAGTDNVYLNYGVNGIDSYKSSWSWFISSTWNKSNNSYSLPTGAVGFCTPGGSSSSEFYGNVNFVSNKTTSIDIYVTGTTEIGFIYQNNNTSTNRWIDIVLKEVNNDGTDAESATFTAGNNGTTLQYVATSTLNANKYYHLQLSTSGGSTSKFYSITFKRNTCATTITTQPSGATIALGDANPELSIVATNAASYAWKESSDGTSYDGVSTLGSSSSYTPSVNDAVQTKYYYCEVTSDCDGTTIVKSDIVTVNVVGAISYYTITLVPAGGTIDDATGWTLNAGKYEKEVAEGSSVTLPTFTKDDRTFKTWRNSADIDIELPITITKDTTLTAVWAKTIVKTIYSWEGAEGGASEVGGTVEGSADNLINQVSAGYYCLKIDGKADWSTNHVDITLSGDEKIKTGDKIKYWGFYNKDKSASARPKMRDANGSNASIFDDPNDLPNLYSGGDPAERTFTVPASINTNAVQLTRSQTGSNTWISKLQIIREEQVEEANIATVTFNSNGGSSVASMEVAKGEAAIKPANPTRSGYVFAGWYLNDAPYDWSSAVNADITLVAHWDKLYTVSFNAGEGEGSMDSEEYLAGAEVTLPACTFTAPTGKEFEAWDCADSTITGGKFTMPAKDVEITALWMTELARYKVAYYDGETRLGVEVVEVGSHPTAIGIDSTKNYFYTVAAWQLSGVDTNLDNVSGDKNDSITLSARYAANYATSVNIEQWVLDNGKKNTEFKALLDTKHYVYSNINELDSLNDDKDNRNYPYLGQKLKAANASLSFLLQSGKTVKIRFGNVAADFKIYEGETANTKTSNDLANATTSSSKVYTYAAEADIIIKIENVTADKTLVVKQIMIDEDIAAITLPDTPTALDNTDVNAKAVKRLENGILIIEKNGRLFNAQGQLIK